MTDAPIKVSADNFARAETDRMFAGLAAQAGSNHWRHNRAPASLDDQTVIRMNRDTLYSFAVVDISNGATLIVPDHGDRYLSVMIVNEDHYINRVIRDQGEYRLTAEEYDTDWVLVAARILVDPTDPADVAAVNALQDQLGLAVDSSSQFVPPDYDKASLDATRDALLDLSSGLETFARGFGRRDEVDPVRHLIGSASGWGGLPDKEASYQSVEPNLPVGDYDLIVGDVPVDAFWSVTVYNHEGYLESDTGVTTVNSVTGVRNPDGTVTIHFGSGDAPNTIPIMDGWNYTVRMYRPRAEILNGSWTFPAIART
jgi:hypothetical protein